MEENNLRFEEAMQQLEEIVQKLEAGDAPLEDAIKLYQRGMELSAFCQSKLQNAEKQLISMIDSDGNATPFNPMEGDDDEPTS